MSERMLCSCIHIRPTYFDNNIQYVLAVLFKVYCFMHRFNLMVRLSSLTGANKLNCWRLYPIQEEKLKKKVLINTKPQLCLILLEQKAPGPTCTVLQSQWRFAGAFSKALSRPQMESGHRLTQGHTYLLHERALARDVQIYSSTLVQQQRHHVPDTGQKRVLELFLEGYQ